MPGPAEILLALTLFVGDLPPTTKDNGAQRLNLQ
jgi:hypothetical protein